jgi:hypothetical protein
VCEDRLEKLAQPEQLDPLELTALKDRGVLMVIPVLLALMVIQQLFKLGLRRQAIQELTPRLSTVGQFRTLFSTLPFQEELTRLGYLQVELPRNTSLVLLATRIKASGPLSP